MQALMIRPVDTLVDLITRREREIRSLGTSMLLMAAAQGSDLIALKEMCPHGTFMDTVARTGISPVTARRYMQVAKAIPWERFDAGEFSGMSIKAFLDIRDKPKAPQPFTRTDAEYALKIAALADRGVEGEQAAAKAKLDSLAKTFGTDAEGLVQKAQKLCPEHGLAGTDAKAVTLREQILAPFSGMSKRQLLDAIFDLILKLSEVNDEDD